MKLICFFSITFFLLFSCKTKINCPPDKKVGMLLFTTTAKEYIPSYQSRQILVFKNQNDERLELTIQQTEQSTNNRLCLQKICSTLDVKSKTTCQYLGGEVTRFFLSGKFNGKELSGDLLFTHLQPTVYVKEFITAMRFSMDYEGTSMSGYIIEKDFSKPVNESQLKSELGGIMVKQNKLKLNDQEFTEVYVSEKQYPYFYFTKKQGLVGFKTSSTTWNLVY